jgi:hypothetical protein
MDDLRLETQIDAAALRLATADTPAGRRAAWSELKALISRRSAERIAQMERDRGLAA